MPFEDKVVLITGGTGSLGGGIIDRLMASTNGSPRKIIILSRDEAKQFSLKIKLKHLTIATDSIFYDNFDERISFRIADVRNYESLLKPVREADIIIHAAALKQVPVCEYFPDESIYTNVLGAMNLVRAVEETPNHVEVVLATSTDKACKPVNAYGMCKAIQERLFVAANLGNSKTRFVCVRYGNVLLSRGSVIPLFQEQILAGEPLTVTSPSMTRFFISLDNAVNTIVEALQIAKPGEVVVPILPAAQIIDLAEALVAGRADIPIKFIGVRPGEKDHEVLISEEEISRTYKNGKYYLIQPMLPELAMDIVPNTGPEKEYSSADRVIPKEELKRFLITNKIIQREL